MKYLKDGSNINGSPIWNQIDPYCCNSINGNTSLHFGAMTANSSMMKYLLNNVYQLQNREQMNIDRLELFVNKKNKRGRTVTHLVALIKDESNRLCQLKLLMNFDADVKLDFSCPKSNESPIHTACKVNNHKFIEYWMQHNNGNQEKQKETTQILNQTTNDDERLTPLMIAIMYSSIDCVRIICNYRWYKQLIAHTNNLQFCVKFGNSNILKIMLAAQLKIYDVHGWESFKLSPYMYWLTNIVSISDNNDHDQSNNCTTLLKQIVDKGIVKQDYNTIALLLDYDVAGVMSSHHYQNGSSIPNMTVFVNKRKDFGAEKLFAIGTKPMGNDNSDLDLDVNDNNNHDEEWLVYDTIGEGGFGCVKYGYMEQVVKKLH